MGKILGNKIKEIRKRKGLTQQQFAESLGYSHKSVINKIETGKKEMSYQKILLLIKEYALNASDFINIEDIDKINSLININKENNRKERCIIYIHGLHGSSEEADFYSFLNDSYDVIRLDYKDGNPWDVKDIIIDKIETISSHYKEINIIANSIGAFYAINYLSDIKINKALFISPIVNMKAMIESMMNKYHISLKDLEEKKEIILLDGQTLSYSFYNEMLNKKLQWKCETSIVYGEKDELVSQSDIIKFSANTSSSLYVFKNGEHWFHKPNQIKFIKTVAVKMFVYL